MKGYMTAQEAAELWGVTARQMQILYKENRISEAQRVSRIWLIPEGAHNPNGKDLKRRSSETVTRGR